MISSCLTLAFKSPIPVWAAPESSFLCLGPHGLPEAVWALLGLV